MNDQTWWNVDCGMEQALELSETSIAVASTAVIVAEMVCL